ncbi:MAG: hypothetical protein IJZ46_05855 [Bacilli bacterium]|nr:hypothetical protein [Bacilli bacterium]
MESRMEKYYKDDLSTFKRTKKNEELYKDISKEISNLENLPISNNSNEIDMDGLKEIISSREEYRKREELSKTFISDKPLVEESKKNDRVYDINVLLENAKNEVNRSASVTGEKRVNANFLTNLDDADIPNNNDAIEISTSVTLEKKETVNTNSLPLDILVDLKGNDNTIVTDPIVKEEVTMIKKIKDGETFYSGSFNFSKKDFDEEDDDFIIEKSHTGIKVFFLILGILLLLGVIYLIVTKYVL